MFDAILENEATVRLVAFGVMLIVMALWELAAPKRRVEIPRIIRWTNNLGLVVVDSIVVRLLFPLLAVGVAVVAQDRSWGLLHSVDIPGWLAVLIAVLVLDFAIYLQHVLFHAVPAFWRLHRVHHADLEFDLTTGLRFHPIEIILSMIWKMAIVASLGAPPIAVLIFEVVLNASALFNHSNVALPRGLDAILRLFIVTPDMHRVHHSVHVRETNSNFGFNVPWWDRLFGTYIAQPRDGHQGMSIGIEQFRTTRDLRIDRMLVQPFVDASGRVPLGGGPKKPSPENDDGPS
jgi:sterol desaturase/sphingolipid hydroxylase (fatty acid hydroxylase superfamily)